MLNTVLVIAALLYLACVAMYMRVNWWLKKYPPKHVGPVPLPAISPTIDALRINGAVIIELQLGASGSAAYIADGSFLNLTQVEKGMIAVRLARTKHNAKLMHCNWHQSNK